MAVPSGLPCLPTTPLIERCTLLCEQCIAHVDSSDFFSNEEIVHELRIATKQLRAAWHLVKAAGPDLAKQRRAALRSLSAAFASQRDHDVLLGLASELAAESDNNEAFAVLIESLSRDLALSILNSNDCPLDAEAIRNGWTEELAAWRSLAPVLEGSSLRRKIFRDALRKSASRALHATRAALADPKADAELWHEWRKAVKRLRYQREFIADTQGRQLGILDGRIRRLGTRLGERNDLANLIKAVESLSNLGQQQHGQLRKAIAEHERDVISSARRLGRLAFLR
jgi:CHAD domain-containing protein